MNGHSFQSYWSNGVINKEFNIIIGGENGLELFTSFYPDQDKLSFMNDAFLAAAREYELCLDKIHKDAHNNTYIKIRIRELTALLKVLAFAVRMIK